MQLKVVECIGHGQDCILIAGCGWGKTLVYFLPLVLWSTRTIVVISPLRALIKEQQKKLDQLAIENISFLNKDDTFKPDILQDLAEGKFRAVFLTPEIIFESERLKPLWSKPAWQQKLQAIVLDEAHCVATWGTTFRTSYDRIGELRSKVPPGIAFIAVSATLPPKALDELKERVHFDQATTIINIGNDRPNVRLEVQSIYLRDKYSHLDFLMDFKKTIVYFQTRKETMEAASHLKGLARTAVAEGRIHSCFVSKIAAYHALFSEEYKEEKMEAFRQGSILLLLATEAAGMGCDIGDVIRVVQFKCPTDISCLVQRLG